LADWADTESTVATNKVRATIKFCNFICSS
jgi:hypothetical protein